MAPSLLDPYPGYGIYTTQFISKGDPILSSSSTITSSSTFDEVFAAADTISIPLHDMRTFRYYGVGTTTSSSSNGGDNIHQSAGAKISHPQQQQQEYRKLPFYEERKR